MATYVPLSKSRHIKMGWRPTQDYRFAAAVTRIPVVVEEIESLLPHYPLYFQPVSTKPLSFELRALLSPVAGNNLFVKDDGQWLAGYVPAVARIYPFQVLRRPDGQEPVVCINEESLVPDSSAPGVESLFSSDGQPAGSLAGIMTFLHHFSKSTERTGTLVSLLQEAGLIVPWGLRYQTGEPSDTEGQAGEEGQLVTGLFHIDRQALQRLEGDTLQKLHKQGALQLAYAQLLSEQRVSLFSKAVAVHEARRKQRPDLGGIFEEEEEGFNFDVFGGGDNDT